MIFYGHFFWQHKLCLYTLFVENKKIFISFFFAKAKKTSPNSLFSQKQNKFFSVKNTHKKFILVDRKKTNTKKEARKNFIFVAKKQVFSQQKARIKRNLIFFERRNVLVFFQKIYFRFFSEQFALKKKARSFLSLSFLFKGEWMFIWKMEQSTEILNWIKSYNFELFRKLQILIVFWPWKGQTVLFFLSNSFLFFIIDNSLNELFSFQKGRNFKKVAKKFEII